MVPSVMVIGPELDAGHVISALRDRGIHAWSDRLGRVAPDFVSFDWANAIVVIDPTPQLESRHVRPITEFHGATVLATPKPLSGEERAHLLGHGFDSIVGWPSSTEVIAAYVDRFLMRSIAGRLERLHA